MEVLEGKVDLVTGASRGVGAAIARIPAEEGAVVVDYLKHGRRTEIVADGIFPGFSRNLAAELGPHNVTVNMDAGGLMDETNASAAITEEVRRLVAGSTPLGRLGPPRIWGAPSSCSPRRGRVS